jgi:hypothetical protein
MDNTNNIDNTNNTTNMNTTNMNTTNIETKKKMPWPIALGLMMIIIISMGLIYRAFPETIGVYDGYRETARAYNNTIGLIYVILSICISSCASASFIMIKK